MKTIFTIFLIAAFTVTAYAQRMEVGLKGIAKSTWLFNENISNEGEEQDYDSGWGFNSGLTFTYYFNKVVGVETGLFIGRHAGSYIGRIPNDGSFRLQDTENAEMGALVYNSRIALSTVDIPLLIKTKSRAGFYFEMGAQYSFITKAKYSAEHLKGELEESIVTAYYPNDNISLLAGFGLSRDLSDKFRAIMGFRFDYGMSDLRGVDAVGRALVNPIIYPEYHRTRSVGGGVLLGVAYKIGEDYNRGDAGDNTKTKIKIEREIEENKIEEEIKIKKE